MWSMAVYVQKDMINFLCKTFGIPVYCDFCINMNYSNLQKS